MACAIIVLRGRSKPEYLRTIGPFEAIDGAEAWLAENQMEPERNPGDHATYGVVIPFTPASAPN